MMSVNQLARRFFLLLLAAAVCLSAGCDQYKQANRVQEAEAKLKHPAPPEDTSTPEERNDWNTQNILQAYESIGSKNPSWDPSAREALELWIKTMAKSDEDDGEDYSEAIKAALKKAVTAGCDDPLILWLHAEYFYTSKENKAENLKKALVEMEPSKYGELFKFISVAETYNAVEALQGSSPEAADLLNRSSRYLNRVLQDRTVPAARIDRACHRYLYSIQGLPNEKDLYEAMEALLLKNWPRSLACLIAGEFYIDYAWKARSSKSADKVTPEQWRQFRERLQIAEMFLREGARLNPKDPRLPQKMINVAAGQGTGLPEMEMWFEKAMEADPNFYGAGDTLLYFMLPRWYGSREEMLALGRRCVASEKWGGTVPLLLAGAHYMYNRFDGARDGSYWLGPDVWPDIKASYERYFAINSKPAFVYRQKLARYAYWCQQWDALRQYLDALGDKADPDFFGGKEQYDKMLKSLADHTAAKAR